MKSDYMIISFPFLTLPSESLLLGDLEFYRIFPFTFTTHMMRMRITKNHLKEESKKNITFLH